MKATFWTERKSRSARNATVSNITVVIAASDLRINGPTRSRSGWVFTTKHISGDVLRALYLSAISAACSVLRNNIAMVIGPTPPGTGVMKLATSLTSSNATSPTSR